MCERDPVPIPSLLEEEYVFPEGLVEVTSARRDIRWVGYDKGQDTACCFSNRMIFFSKGAFKSSYFFW
jgi:hypothetical protein